MRKIPRFRPSLSTRTIFTILNKILFTYSRIADTQKIQQFEEQFAKYIGAREAIAVPSGRIGLFLILNNLGLHERSQIILPSFTYWVVPHIISLLNFEPVFVDINLNTYNLDVSQVEKNITKFTKVILPTHLYGLPCWMDEILAIAKKYNLLVVEDCVQACGAEYKGKKVGSLGEAAYFSFGITKNLPLLGGGMVITNDDKLAQRIREEISSYDFVNRKQLMKKAIEALAIKIFTQPFIFSIFLFPLIRLSYLLGKDVVGQAFEERQRLFERLPKSYFKLILSDHQAEVGLKQLPNLDILNNKRIRNALYLLENLKSLSEISLPSVPGNGIKNIFTNFPIRAENRYFLARELLRRGIDTSCGYIKAHGKTCPNAMAVEQSILHIPIHHCLDARDLSYICQEIKDIFEKKNQ